MPIRPEPQCIYYYKARPNQYFFLNEFITPVHYEIWKIAKDIEGDTLMEVGPKIWERVMSKIKYVLDSEQFHTEEYFQFPHELLRSMKGDCEDTANLCTSLLNACGVLATTVYGTVTIRGRTFKHAWTEAEGYVLETTYPRWRPIPPIPEYDGEYYISWGYGSYKVTYVEGKPQEVRGWNFRELPEGGGLYVPEGYGGQGPLRADGGEPKEEEEEREEAPEGEVEEVEEAEWEGKRKGPRKATKEELEELHKFIEETARELGLAGGE